MIIFENDMEPVLVAFIYGEINYEIRRMWRRI